MKNRKSITITKTETGEIIAHIILKEDGSHNIITDVDYDCVSVTWEDDDDYSRQH